jgi:Mrp family chromosome partitioning ATPase
LLITTLLLTQSRPSKASLLPLTYQSQSPCMVLLFASALPFEGKSTTVAAPGAGIANNGGRVLLY